MKPSILMIGLAAVGVALAVTVSQRDNGNVPRIAVEGESVPTGKFLSAALVQQGELLPRQLRVHYIERICGPESNPKCRVLKNDYVRSPNALYFRVEEEGQATYEQSSDIRTREHRRLRTDPGGDTVGEVRYGVFSGSFCEQDLLDTARFPLYEETLSDALPRAEVKTEMEPVGGHVCWRAEIAGKRWKGRYIVWLDPEIGYCPRRVDFVFPAADKTPKTFLFSDHKEVSPGVYYPQKQEIRTEQDGRKITTQGVVDSLTLGSEGEPEKLVAFPPGTPITDFTSGASRTAN
ncbi:MAG: hypothetical protein WCL39_07925 [Armatimonadota bacterium]